MINIITHHEDALYLAPNQLGVGKRFRICCLGTGL